MWVDRRRARPTRAFKASATFNRKGDVRVAGDEDIPPEDGAKREIDKQPAPDGFVALHDD